MTIWLHPECDEQSEKAVQRVKKMIWTNFDKNSENWDEGLSRILFAYNSSVYETTGQTQFETMFGPRSTIPIDTAFKNSYKSERKWRNSVRTKLTTDKYGERRNPRRIQYTREALKTCKGKNRESEMKSSKRIRNSQ